MANQKRTKEDRENEFVDAIEQVLGFPFLPWQRRMVIDIRQATVTGKPIKVDRHEIMKRRQF